MRLLADHSMECGDELSSIHQQGNAVLDRRDGDGLRLRQRIAASRSPSGGGRLVGLG